MGQPRQRFLALVTGVCLALGLTGFAAPAPRFTPRTDPALLDDSGRYSYAQRAARIAQYTHSSLLHLPSGQCGSSPFASYRWREATRAADPWASASDPWANASQMVADLTLGAPNLACYVAKVDQYNARLWDDKDPAGGYFPRGYVDGRQSGTSDKYVDDNALVGLALLDAYEQSADPAERTRYLTRARSAARWLITSGLWDETFGGGFWWNNSKGSAMVGKAAQGNGLAWHLLARLYHLTRDPSYRDWALRIRQWLDATLYDYRYGLYRWGIGYYDGRSVEREAIVWGELFSYDQGILIEASLAHWRYIADDPVLLDRARLMASQLEPFFWNDRLGGGFNLQYQVDQVYTVYSAWLTPSLLALYGADPDSHWLELARRNVEALQATLANHDSAGRWDGSYAFRKDLSVVEPLRHTISQAWMQRAYALLARYEA